MVKILITFAKVSIFLDRVTQARKAMFSLLKAPSVNYLSILVKIFKIYVMSHLDYGSIIWNLCYSKDIMSGENSHTHSTLSLFFEHGGLAISTISRNKAELPGSDKPSVKVTTNRSYHWLLCMI